MPPPGVVGEPVGRLHVRRPLELLEHQHRGHHRRRDRPAPRRREQIRVHLVHLRPVYHRKADRIIAHVQLSWLALLLIRTAEIATGDTWRNLAAELDRLRLHTYDTGQGTVSQHTRLTAKQRAILEALELPEPPRYYDFDPLND
jgi:hypothetical protein